MSEMTASLSLQINCTTAMHYTLLSFDVNLTRTTLCLDIA